MLTHQPDQRPVKKTVNIHKMFRKLIAVKQPKTVMDEGLDDYVANSPLHTHHVNYIKRIDTLK